MSSFSVNTNVGALTALQQINRTNLALLETQNRVNTGLNVRGAKDNAGLFAIAQNLRADLRGFDAVRLSIDRATSTLDIGLAAAESISDLLIEAQEKIVAASDEGIDDNSREALNTDFRAILRQIDTIAESAEFNGTKLVSKNPNNITAITDPTANPDRVVRIEGADLTTTGEAATATGLNTLVGGTRTSSALTPALLATLEPGGVNDPATTANGQAILIALNDIEEDDGAGQDVIVSDANGNFSVDFSTLTATRTGFGTSRFEATFGDVTLASGEFATAETGSLAIDATVVSGLIADPTSARSQAILTALNAGTNDTNNVLTAAAGGTVSFNFADLTAVAAGTNQSQFSFALGGVTFTGAAFTSSEDFTVTGTLVQSFLTAGALAGTDSDAARFASALDGASTLLAVSTSGSIAVNFLNASTRTIAGGTTTDEFFFTLGGVEFVSNDVPDATAFLTSASIRGEFGAFATSSGTPTVLQADTATLAADTATARTALSAAGGLTATGAGSITVTVPADTATVQAGFKDAISDFSVQVGTQSFDYYVGQTQLTTISLFSIDLTDAGYRQVAIDVLNVYSENVENILIRFGAGANTLEAQRAFVTRISDTVEVGIGNLVDADLARESARLQALQVQQQLGVQALSIANGQPQIILSLFGG